MENKQRKSNRGQVKFWMAAVLSAVFLSSYAAQALADFDPGNLVPDSVFADTKTFGGPAGIQQFLVAKGSVLANTDPTFLLKLGEPQDASTKTALSDPEPNLPRLRTAAELIWDAGQGSGLNPQVIVVTLQKEQSLITGTFSSDSSLQTALNHALGFGCPDSGGCGAIYSGFYYQLFGNLDAQGNRYLGAAFSLMRSYNTPNGRGPMVDVNSDAFGSPAVRVSHVGDTIYLQNTQGPPNNAAPVQAVTIGNLSTAALYRYTPHVYNGNYNFWKFFTQWFKYPNGSILTISGSGVTGNGNVYIVENGALSLAPTFVLMSKGINLGTVTTISISPTEFSSYDKGPTLAPPDDTIVTISDDSVHETYVFEQGVRHPVSSFVLTQRGLNVNNALGVTSADASLYTVGTLLPPSDGTVIKGDGSPNIYIIQNGTRMLLTPFTYHQYGYDAKPPVKLPQGEVDSYAQGGFLLPKNGTLLKYAGQPEVYELKDQLLRPISGTVFNLNGFKFASVVTVKPEEVASAPVGLFVPPPDGTYFTVTELGTYYQYSNSSRHLVSKFVAQQRAVAKKSVTLGLEEALDIPEGTPLPPVDGTLIKGDQSAAIYAIVAGQKTPLDYATWKTKYKKRAPSVLPQAEVDSYPLPSAQSADVGGQ